jgi:hypothetical protein
LCGVAYNICKEVLIMKKKFKKLFLSIADAATALSCIPTYAFAAEEEYLCGDADSNGTVDAVDASLVLAYYAEIQTNGSSSRLQGVQLLAADVNESASIDAIDASLILAMYAANQTAVTGYYNGHKYTLYNISMTWLEAEKYCEKLGGHLVTITDDDEQSFVNSLFDETASNCYWIGLSRSDENWEWVTGEEFNYSNWTKNEPNNEKNIEFYVHLFGKVYTGGIGTKNIGEWNDASESGASYAGSFYDSSAFGFICEWE